MVHHQFAALGDPTRLAMVERLARGPTSVGELAAPTTMSLPAVLKHIRVLEDAGLIRRTVVGREHLLALDARPLKPAAEWIDGYRTFWDARLDALDRHLREGRRR